MHDLFSGWFARIVTVIKNSSTNESDNLKQEATFLIKLKLNNVDNCALYHLKKQKFGKIKF